MYTFIRYIEKSNDESEISRNQQMLDFLLSEEPFLPMCDKVFLLPRDEGLRSYKDTVRGKASYFVYHSSIIAVLNEHIKRCINLGYHCVLPTSLNYYFEENHWLRCCEIFYHYPNFEYFTINVLNVEEGNQESVGDAIKQTRYKPVEWNYQGRIYMAPPEPQIVFTDKSDFFYEARDLTKAKSKLLWMLGVRNYLGEETPRNSSISARPSGFIHKLPMGNLSGQLNLEHL